MLRDVTNNPLVGFRTLGLHLAKALLPPTANSPSQSVGERHRGRVETSMVVKPAAAVGLPDPHPNQPLVPRLAQPSPAVKLFIRELHQAAEGLIRSLRCCREACDKPLGIKRKGEKHIPGVGPEHVTVSFAQLPVHEAPGDTASIKCRISLTDQAVMRGPKRLVGCGYRPDFTPAHQVERETGMIGGTPRLGSPMIWARRK